MNLFKSWKTYIYALFIHPTDAKVFLRFNQESLTQEKLRQENLCQENLQQGHYELPSIEVKRGISFDDFESVKNEIHKALNIFANVLYNASYDVDKNQRQIQIICVLEQQHPIDNPSVGTWFELSTVKGLTFDRSEHKSIAEKCLIELELENIPPLRPLWAKPGWMDDTSGWIDASLAQSNYQKAIALEYIRNWSLSCVLKLQTPEGNVYFKESSIHPPLFCNEPKVTRTLATLFPQHIPTIIAADDQHHRMILEDFGHAVGHKISFKEKKDIYSLFVNIQIQSIQHQEQLLTAGCLDRRLDILQSQIDPLVNAEETLSALSATEMDQLQGLAPTLKRLCSQLADYNIPETLVHGDLHLGNVALFREHYLFFDWTDSCIAHPFFDLFEFCLSGKKTPLGRLRYLWQQNAKQKLQNGYLNQWQSYESAERLLEAWAIAKPLCLLHHSVTYQSLLHSLEERAKREINILPYLLRELIGLDVPHHPPTR